MNPNQYKDYDLFKLYFEYTRDTEAPTIYHRWSLIGGLGAFLGRRFWLQFGEGKVYPNSYIMLIGNPGTRKSSAIKTAKRTLVAAGYETFAAERTTKEKFLLDLEGHGDGSPGSGSYDGGEVPANKRTGATARDVLANLDLGTGGEDHDGIPREVFITADEFNEFAGAGNLDFLSTLGALWDWDDEALPYRQRFKNSKSISIYQPTISILGGNTHQSFQAAFPAAAIGQGFLSRLILVHSEPSGRKITFPKPADERLLIAIGEKFNAIKENVRGEASMTDSARNALDTIYKTWPEIEDYRFKHYSTRRFTHLLKMCLICAASRCTTRIDIPDVLLANTILAFTENSMPKALGEYGKQRFAEASQALMTALYETKTPMKFEELYKVVQRDIEKRDQLLDILNNLQAAGKIRALENRQGFLPMQRPVNSRLVYTDFKLLKEYN